MPISGVTSSGGVLVKVPESDARCVAASHSEHRFPAPSSKLCPIWFTLYLRAAVHRRGQSPPEGLDTNKIVKAT